MIKMDSDNPLIDQFSDNLWLSDGLAKNTIESYRRDVLQLHTWLKKSARGKDLADALHAKSQVLDAEIK